MFVFVCYFILNSVIVMAGLILITIINRLWCWCPEKKREGVCVCAWRVCLTSHASLSSISCMHCMYKHVDTHICSPAAGDHMYIIVYIVIL